MNPAHVPPGQPPTDVASCPLISWAFTCTGGVVTAVHATIPATPSMGRDPDTIPDYAGDGYSGFLGIDGGVNPGFTGPPGNGFPPPAFGPQFVYCGTQGGGPGNGPAWQGAGAPFWTLLVNGAAVAAFSEQDGEVGPFTVPVNSSGIVTATPWAAASGFEPVIDIDWTSPSNVAQLVAYYYDRPSFVNFYMCNAPFSYFGLSHPTGFFDPWVSTHHGNPFAADRNGNDLGFVGPWGNTFPPQTFRDGDLICETSLLVTPCSLMAWEEFPQVAYPVACPPQPVPQAFCGANVHIWKRYGRI